MEKKEYVLNNTKDLISPALVYYKDIIIANTRRIIDMAGGADKLWPHVKSHKTAELVRMQMEMGISRFKCATIAEAEMTAMEGAEHIILAYPLIGPNIGRFLSLARAFPKTVFYAIGDDYEQLSLLAGEARSAGMVVNVLIDADIGMHRTGVPLSALESFYERTCALEGLKLKGIHGYDGQSKNPDYLLRKEEVDGNDQRVAAIKESLKKKGLDCGIFVMGGSPSFPCRTGKSGFYLSPGTIFIGDWGYYSALPDLAFTPGAALFCRVVSHQNDNTFTLDLGSKGIAADPAGARGVIAGLMEAKPVFQSEEHWVFSLPAGTERPPIGTECYVIPTHVCPTSALYPEILVAQGGAITERWEVKARNRRINF